MMLSRCQRFASITKNRLEQAYQPETAFQEVLECRFSFLRRFFPAGRLR